MKNRSRTSSSPVTVRRLDPGTGWSLADARALLDQGYSVERVGRLTGWPHPMLLAPRV